MFRSSVIAFCCLTQFCWAEDSRAPHARNFGAVNDRLFRGGEPSPEALQELGAMGVKMVIDLRETSGKTEFEKAQSQKLGIKYVNVPMKALSAPKQAEIENVLSLILHNQSQPVFVHCWRGKDRTGTVIACYRIQHDGWDNLKALQEAKEYGMSPVQHAMRSYILHFTPLVMQDILKAAN